MPDAEQEFRELLGESLRRQASDLHLSAEAVPFFRVFGQLQMLGDAPLPGARLEAMASSIMHEQQWRKFQQLQTLDLAYSLPSHERFRINAYRQRGRLALAIRRLDQEFRGLAELRLPTQLQDLAELRHGLVLITGPTGSGKTTTLATLIHHLNCTRSCKIITIEDPIEYLHENRLSLIHQRELYSDVPSFAEAVRATLREDPDVILVGEMRDTETMRAAVTAAETGHLVFSTLHTGDTVGALDRTLGVFPAEEQPSVRHQLSMVLQAVVAQQLLPRHDGSGRVPAVEILRVNSAVAHQIRSGKFEQIYSTIEGGSACGMQTMEQSLAELVAQGLVDTAVATRAARNPRLVQARLQMSTSLPQAPAAINHAPFSR